jgi:hypothetical protein
MYGQYNLYYANNQQRGRVMSITGIDLEFGSESGAPYPVKLSIFENSHEDTVIGIITDGMDFGVCFPVEEWPEIRKAIDLLLSNQEQQQ